MQIKQILLQSAEYPELLAEIKDPPKALYVLGEIPVEPMVAIVGTRKMTPYGYTHTQQIATELASAGVVVVSGLATGVDGTAHRAALDAGGKTVAVLGGGLNRIYPSEHRDLAKEILATGGALISEHPTGAPSHPGHFVIRNRIIAGLALATVIPEAPVNSGALHTANYALKNDRLLMALPANIGNFFSGGTNNLLREGAIPITSGTDVLNHLNIPHKIRPVIERANNPFEKLILKLLKTGVSTTEQLIAQAKITPAEFANLITLMEITGQIRNLGGGNWAPRIVAKQKKAGYQK